MATLVTSVKVRLVKPLNKDWKEVGARLRELAWFGHRVLNATITRLAMATEVPELVPDSWKSKINENSTLKPGGKPSSYQMTHCAINAANVERVTVRLCAWCKGTGIEPGEPPLDKKNKPIKVTKLQAKKECQAGGICSRCDGIKEYKIGEEVEIPSSIVQGWSRMADRKYANDKVEVFKGTKTLPNYKAPAPIAFTSSGQVFKIRKDDKGYILDIPIYPKGAKGNVSFVIGIDGATAHAHMQRIMEGGKLGDLKILPPKENEKWLAVISYSYEKELVEQTGEDAVIKGNSIDGSPELVISGRHPKRLYEGPNIIQKRKVFAIRRASRSKHQRDISKGARGHGRHRALEHFHAVDDAEGRWVKSLCQEIAAKAAREVILRGCRWVVINEEFNLLPPAMLKECVEWALKKSGVQKPAAVKE